MRKIGLVIPVLNNFKGLTELLSSAMDDLGDTVFPIIVDNWMPNGNRGVSISWNEGTRYAFEFGCTHVLISNDDVVYSKGLANILADRLDQHDKCILATGRNIRGQEGFDNTVEGLEKFRASDEGDGPDFSCFMITRRTIDLAGTFDENFTPAYFEDNDYHHRIHLAGYITANTAMAPMYHKGSQTQNHTPGKPVITGKMFDLNRKYYERKWGGSPGQEIYRNPFNDLSRDSNYWRAGEKT